MIFNEENSTYYDIDGNTIFLSNLSANSAVLKYEQQLFSEPPKSPLVVHYKLLSKDDKSILDYEKENAFMLPYPQFGLLSDFLNVEGNNFLNILKKQKKFNDYIKKWIYQLVNSFHDIHIKKEFYHGYITDRCIFIDAKLNLQIGDMGFYGDSSVDQKYFLNYCDNDRANEVKKVTGDFCFIYESEAAKENAVDNFRKYDIFALGKIIEKILNLSELKNGDDNDFRRRINDDIIKLCLEPSNTRPTIDKIRSNLDQIFKMYESNETIDIDKILKSCKLSVLKGQQCRISEIIAKRFEKNPELMSLLHTEENPENIRFGLHDNYKFFVFYDADEKSFITKPILVKNEKLSINLPIFNDQLKAKLAKDAFCKYFFYNLYFCSFKDLLKIYKPSFTEIHYWMIYFTNYIQALQSGDFLEDGNEHPGSIDSWDAHLPLNFSSETVFVSFINYKNHNKFDVFKNKPLQFQLSVFPFEAQKTKLSKIYKSDLEEFSNKRDIYSFGVLLLEVLHSAIFGENCFNEEDDEFKIVSNIMTKVIDGLPKDQKFYINILNGCINQTFDDIFQVQSILLLEGRDEDKEFSLEEFPSDNLNNYVTLHQTMNQNRFLEIFKCIEDINDDNIQKLFRNTLNDLNQNFFKEDFDLRQELNYLNFIDSIKKEE